MDISQLSEWVNLIKNHSPINGLAMLFMGFSAVYLLARRLVFNRRISREAFALITIFCLSWGAVSLTESGFDAPSESRQLIRDASGGVKRLIP